MSRPRVIIVTPSADTRVGGVERFSNLLDAALRPTFDTEFFEVRRAPRGNRLAALGWLRDSRATAEAIARLGHADLVITGVTVGANFDPRVPRIHVCHGTMPKNAAAAKGEPLRARASAMIGGGAAERLATRSATEVVAVSRMTGRELSTTLGARRPVRIIENGIDPAIFRPRDRVSARLQLGWEPEEKIALFVGRPELRKGIDIAAKSTQSAGWELYVAGSQPHSRGRWVGLLDEATLPLAYSAADAVIFPTRYEACSYTLLEAIACGATVLTTSTGWASDVAKENPRFADSLIEPNVSAFTQALLEFRARKDELSSAFASVRDRVMSRNTFEQFGKQWLELCSEVLATQRRSTAS